MKMNQRPKPPSWTGAPGSSATRQPGRTQPNRNLGCGAHQAEPMCRPSNDIEGVSRPVGRVLCARSRGAAVIHLGLPLPTASCGLPASIGRAALDRSRREPLVPLLTLLRVGFTKPPQSPAALVVSYTTVSPLPPRCRGGGLFSVALSRGSPRVGVTDHPALWSPDLPHRACARRDRPADSPMLRIRRTPPTRRS